MRSCFICSNLRLSSPCLSSLFWALPTYRTLPFSSLPFISVTAYHKEKERLQSPYIWATNTYHTRICWITLLASLWFSKLTNPKPRECPLSSVITQTLRVLPVNQSQLQVRCRIYSLWKVLASVLWSGAILYYII